MKKVYLIFCIVLLFSIDLSASERSIRNYRETFCKEKSTTQLHKEYIRVTQELDAMIKQGSDDCKNASDTFDTASAERVGRKLYDGCESYRVGKIRKKIHKDKVIKEAVERELISRGAFKQ